MLGFLEFGPLGVIACKSLLASKILDSKLHKLTDTTASLAAAFQSAVYGGFTPAGGLFAFLTSMAMKRFGAFFGFALLMTIFIMAVAARCI